MKNRERIINISRLLFFIALIIFIHVGQTLAILKKITMYEFSNILQAFGIIALVIYIADKIINKKRFNIYDMIIIILSILGIISTIFAYNKGVAIWGTRTRFEGILSLISYYLIFLLATTVKKKEKKILLWLVIFFGLLQIIIGTIQTLKINVIFNYDRSNNFSTKFAFASGTLGNPNFYATYILMCALFVLASFFSAKSRKTKILFGILSIIFAYGVFIGSTTSTMLIYGLFLLIGVFKELRKKKLKNIIISFLIFISAFGIILTSLNHFVDNKVFNSIKYNTKEIVNIFKYGIKDSTGSNRIYVWKTTLKQVPKNIINGVGVDNFSFVDNGKKICIMKKVKKSCFDKAHNDYLQILITEGIFALITYLILITLVLINGFINSKKNQDNSIFWPTIGYLLQMMFVFSVIRVAPIFYMILAFNIDEENKITIRRLRKK